MTAAIPGRQRRYRRGMALDFDRRRLLTWSATGLAAGALARVPAAGAATERATTLISALGRDATQFGIRPGSPDDQTRLLQRAIDECARTAIPLALPPGVYRSGPLTLPDNAQVIGVRGATKIAFTGGAWLMASEGAGNLALTGLVLDGSGLPLPAGRGLVHCQFGRTVRIEDCEIVETGGGAIWFENVSGHVRSTQFRNIGRTAIVSFDAKGLLIAQNTILGANSNGIEILRHVIGDDGTIVTDNRIETIKAGPGGSGQYGNAINAFRAGNVIVRGNRIRDCDFSAVRGNSSSNIQITGNSVVDVRECALFSEFSFEAAIIAHNTVDGAGVGISVANFNEGGRLAVVQGNIIRNLKRELPPADGPDAEGGTGIFVEADSSVTGNVIENAPTFGIGVGWGPYLRDVAVSGNVIRKAFIGIGVSVVQGAGSAMIDNNVISETPRGAVVGLDHARPVTPDLTRNGAEKFAQVVLGTNQVR